MVLPTLWGIPGAGRGPLAAAGFPGPRPRRREPASSEGRGPGHTGRVVQEGRQRWGAPLGSGDRLGPLLTPSHRAAAPGVLMPRLQATGASLSRPPAPAISLSPTQRLTAGHPGGAQGLGGTQQNQRGRRQQVDESLDNTLPWWGRGHRQLGSWGATSRTSGQNEGRSPKAGENWVPGDRPRSQWGWRGPEWGRVGARPPWP